MRNVILSALIAAGAAAPTLAFAQASPVVSAPDPARVAAATRLIDSIFPPATRNQMMESMMRPMLANIQQGMAQEPGFADLVGKNPRARKAFEEFVATQQQRAMETIRAGLPGMTTAMANAYARRFDLDQLHDLQAFFDSPTGRVYMQVSITIMSDPDVAAWQRSLMAQSMAHIQADIAEFSKKIAAIAEDSK